MGFQNLWSANVTYKAVYLFRECSVCWWLIPGNFTELMWLHIVQVIIQLWKAGQLKSKYARFMANIIISTFCFQHGFRQHFSPQETLKKCTIILFVSIYEYGLVSWILYNIRFELLTKTKRGQVYNPWYVLC